MGWSLIKKKQFVVFSIKILIVNEVENTCKLKLVWDIKGVLSWVVVVAKRYFRGRVVILNYFAIDFTVFLD